MTQDAPARLHLVTADDTVAAQVEAADDPVRAASPGRRPAVLVAVGAGLTVGLALLGGQPWPLPVWDGGVSDVPQSLLTFLLLCAGTCVWAAGRTVRPAETLRSPGAVRLWWGLVAGAAVVSVAAGLSMAAAAGSGRPPGDLVVRCLVPLVPAVLAGLLASDAGRAARVRAALGTRLVTVPLGALGWALASSPAQVPAGTADVLAVTGVTGVVPVALAVAFVAADRRGRLAP